MSLECGARFEQACERFERVSNGLGEQPSAHALVEKALWPWRHFRCNYLGQGADLGMGTTGLSEAPNGLRVHARLLKLDSFCRAVRMRNKSIKLINILFSFAGPKMVVYGFI